MRKAWEDLFVSEKEREGDRERRKEMDKIWASTNLSNVWIRNGNKQDIFKPDISIDNDESNNKHFEEGKHAIKVTTSPDLPLSVFSLRILSLKMFVHLRWTHINNGWPIFQTNCNKMIYFLFGSFLKYTEENVCNFLMLHTNQVESRVMYMYRKS